MFGFPHDRFQDAMLDRTDAVALRRPGVAGARLPPGLTKNRFLAAT
jgi:hypothetical protein